MRCFALRFIRLILAGKGRRGHMPTISFDFEPEKFVAATAFFARAGLPDLSQMKLAKLLYFADKRHLLKYGRPIIGDRYVGMKDGPVPSSAYDVMKGATKDSKSKAWYETRELFHEYLEVVPATPHPVFAAKREPDLESLSSSDRAVLAAVARDMGEMTASELRRLAHKEPDYASIEPKLDRGLKQVWMPYWSFFGDADEPIRSLVLAEQEDRDFFSHL